MNQFFTLVLNPFFLYLLQQVLLYCPSQFHMPLTWKLRKMLILPGFSSCLCSEQFPRWSTSMEKFHFRRGFQASCGSNVPSLGGNCYWNDYKTMAIHPFMKITGNRHVNYCHLPVPSCQDQNNFSRTTYSASFFVFYPMPQRPPSKSVFKCPGCLVLVCSKPEPLCWQILVLLLSYEIQAVLRYL